MYRSGADTPTPGAAGPQDGGGDGATPAGEASAGALTDRGRLGASRPGHRRNRGFRQGGSRVPALSILPVGWIAAGSAWGSVACRGRRRARHSHRQRPPRLVRRRARRLSLRHRVRDLRHGLPLPRLAAPAADGACSTGAAGKRFRAARRRNLRASAIASCATQPRSRRASSGRGRRRAGSPTSSCSGAACWPALVTFPLVFGWLHFESVGQDAARYRAFVANVGTVQLRRRRASSGGSCSTRSTSPRCSCSRACSSSCAGGCAIRARSRSSASSDFLALAGLFAVSVTGLMLTASTLWMGGRFYTFLTTVHALTVILGLMYIPFGKLFHIFQRPANLGVAVLPARRRRSGPQQRCAECGEAFASRAADRRPQGRPAAGRLRLRARRRRPLSGRLPALPATARRRSRRSARVGGFG